MAQNEHLPFVDSIYEIWLSKSVDTNFERFLLRNFCSNAFSECVAFYRLILQKAFQEPGMEKILLQRL